MQLPDNSFLLGIGALVLFTFFILLLMAFGNVLMMGFGSVWSLLLFG